MSGQIAVHGRLAADPTSRTTKNDTLMVTVRLAVSLPCHGSDDGYLTMWLGVVAFGKQADFLMRHDKGELVSISGLLQMNQWTNQDNTQQTSYQVMADSVISARTVRPKGRTSRVLKECALSTIEGTGQKTTYEAIADTAQQWDIYAQGGDRNELDQRTPFDDPLL